MCNMYIIIHTTINTWYNGTGWTGGMAVPAMGRWYNPMGSPCLMVQWDGMDRWDGCPCHGTVVQSHEIPLSHGTVGGTIPWDPTSPTWYSGTGWTGRMAVPAMGWWYNPMGSPCLMVQWDEMDRLSQPWDGGTIPWDPTSPTGTGWTGGMAVPTMGRWYNPMGSPCLMVQWDEMDRWHGCPSHGSVVQSHRISMSHMVQWVVQSHGIPLVPHGTVGQDGQVGWLSQPWDGGTIPWDPTSPTWYKGDEMDRWDGCPSHGMVIQSHGIPLSHGTVGRDGQVVPAMGRWYNPIGSH